MDSHYQGNDIRKEGKGESVTQTDLHGVLRGDSSEVRLEDGDIGLNAKSSRITDGSLPQPIRAKN
jgi:hypothetical protein